MPESWYMQAEMQRRLRLLRVRHYVHRHFPSALLVALRNAN